MTFGLGVWIVVIGCVWSFAVLLFGFKLGHDERGKK
jgi:hypothetical protein